MQIRCVHDPEKLPTIYVYCLALGTSVVDVLGCAISEDGEILGQHLSSRHYVLRDMGFVGTRKHDRYAAKYQNGYRLVWLDESEWKDHDGFQKAYARMLAISEAMHV